MNKFQWMKQHPDYRSPGKILSELINVPYFDSQQSKEVEQFFNWNTKELWPESFNNIAQALSKITFGIVAIYVHMPSLNLVLVTSMQERVGIMRTAFGHTRKEYDSAMEALSNIKKIASA